MRSWSSISTSSAPLKRRKNRNAKSPPGGVLVEDLKEKAAVVVVLGERLRGCSVMEGLREWAEGSVVGR
jgi:hypothetical protein